MWNRQQLKEKAKFTFKRNYWKCVLVSLLFAVLVSGSIGSYAASASGQSNHESVRESERYLEQHLYEIDENGNIMPKHHDLGALYDSDYDDWGNYIGDNGYSEDAAETIEQYAKRHPVGAATFMMVFLSVFMIVLVIIMAVAILLNVFICNPIEVGCDRFYFKNLEEPAQAKEVVYAFDHNYKNVVNTMFFRDLYTFLWSLLFIIPGIVKSYEYQMIPYLLAEHPEMTKEQAFAESKRMMDGQKWSSFVLDLSFLGWRILSVFTFGILNIFYVQPYTDASHAALYEALRYNGAPMGAQPQMGNVYMQGMPIGQDGSMQ